jgi:diaminohydroxyphosphoribosylaminopyrimidine deaminase/5-amino-6-(5-phosphoribosylamino)uracil reductase
VVVTLEPCDHTGRTGPCTEALVNAGVARVVYGRVDHDPQAAGGAGTLQRAGVAADLVADPALREAATALVARWQEARDLRRPVVTWKLAATLDGRSAAADGTSRWITGEAARADVHALRAQVDTVLVGTGTAWADDPRLTARDAEGADLPRQPVPVVMGRRGLPPGSALAAAGACVLATRDPAEALRRLWDAGRRQVLLEGGPTLAAAFWRAGLVDHVVAYVAPALLGSGAAAVGDLGIGSIDAIARLRLDDVTRLGDDVRLTLSVERPDPTSRQGTDRAAVGPTREGVA